LNNEQLEMIEAIDVLPVVQESMAIIMDAVTTKAMPIGIKKIKRITSRITRFV
jgi:hypothetical protein